MWNTSRVRGTAKQVTDSRRWRTQAATLRRACVRLVTMIGYAIMRRMCSLCASIAPSRTESCVCRRQVFLIQEGQRHVPSGIVRPHLRTKRRSGQKSMQQATRVTRESVLNRYDEAFSYRCEVVYTG